MSKNYSSQTENVSPDRLRGTETIFILTLRFSSLSLSLTKAFNNCISYKGDNGFFIQHPNYCHSNMPVQESRTCRMHSIGSLQRSPFHTAIVLSFLPLPLQTELQAVHMFVCRNHRRTENASDSPMFESTSEKCSSDNVRAQRPTQITGSRFASVTASVRLNTGNVVFIGVH